MNKTLLMEELYILAEKDGVAKTLNAAFGKNINITIGFSELDCKKRIDEIELSVRAFNCLRRADISTIGEIIDAITTDRSLKIKNLGAKTKNEIKTRLIELAYDSLSVAKKKQFLKVTIEKNIVNFLEGKNV